MKVNIKMTKKMAKVFIFLMNINIKVILKMA